MTINITTKACAYSCQFGNNEASINIINCSSVKIKATLIIRELVLQLISILVVIIDIRTRLLWVSSSNRMLSRLPDLQLVGRT